MDRKGYYKVIGKDDGLYITYSPKEDNGKDVSLEEYMSYLEKKGIDYGTVAELNAAMNEARENKDSKVKISGADVLFRLVRLFGFRLYEAYHDYVSAYGRCRTYNG